MFEEVAAFGSPSGQGEVGWKEAEMYSRRVRLSEMQLRRKESKKLRMVM